MAAGRLVSFHPRLRPGDGIERRTAQAAASLASTFGPSRRRAVARVDSPSSEVRSRSGRRVTRAVRLFLGVREKDLIPGRRDLPAFGRVAKAAISRRRAKSDLRMGSIGSRAADRARRSAARERSLCLDRALRFVIQLDHGWITWRTDDLTRWFPSGSLVETTRSCASGPAGRGQGTSARSSAT